MTIAWVIAQRGGERGQALLRFGQQGGRILGIAAMRGPDAVGGQPNELSPFTDRLITYRRGLLEAADDLAGDLGRG